MQLDELYAVLSAVKAGKRSEAQAITRLSRSPDWVWTAMDPESKLLLSIDVGERTQRWPKTWYLSHAGLSAGLCAPVPDRRFSGIHDGVAEPLWAMGATAMPPGAEPDAQTPLDAAAAATLCASREDRTDGGGSSRSHTAWCLAQKRLSNRCWRPAAGGDQHGLCGRLNLSLRQQVAAMRQRSAMSCKGEDGLRLLRSIPGLSQFQVASRQFASGSG